MGYRDDFYVRANIIGITGPVHQFPSVYFNNAAGEYGHITQVHYYDFNWGRTQVTNDPGWQITNTCPARCGCRDVASHEIDGNGVVFHVSRSLFTPVAQLSPAQLDVAAESIKRCPYAKTDPLYDDLRQQEEARFQALWDQRHAPNARGRPRAVNYTADGLANRIFQIVHPNRV